MEIEREEVSLPGQQLSVGAPAQGWELSPSWEDLTELCPKTSLHQLPWCQCSTVDSGMVTVDSGMVTATGHLLNLSAGKWF